MWKLKSSSSPIAAIGDAKASSSSPSPVANRSTRHVDIGVPRRRSVRARVAYAKPASTTGASCSGSSVQSVNTPPD
jgi:hypothetical protein